MVELMRFWACTVKVRKRRIVFFLILENEQSHSVNETIYWIVWGCVSYPTCSNISIPSSQIRMKDVNHLGKMRCPMIPRKIKEVFLNCVKTSCSQEQWKSQVNRRTILWGRRASVLTWWWVVSVRSLIPPGPSWARRVGRGSAVVVTSVGCMRSGVRCGSTSTVSDLLFP